MLSLFLAFAKMSKKLKAVVLGGTGASGAKRGGVGGALLIVVLAGLSCTTRSLPREATPGPKTAFPTTATATATAALPAGREVVGQLLASPAWGSVVAVGRRPASAPETYQTQPYYDASKLQQLTCELDQLETAAAEAFSGADSVFCCLGTTRSVAGSAEAFRAVDQHGVEAAARAAAAANVRHFGLVSAQGAKAGVWAPDLKLFHGLLYMKCKGKVRGSQARGGATRKIVMARCGCVHTAACHCAWLRANCCHKPCMHALPLPSLQLAQPSHLPIHLPIMISQS